MNIGRRVIAVGEYGGKEERQLRTMVRRGKSIYRKNNLTF